MFKKCLKGRVVGIMKSSVVRWRIFWSIAAILDISQMYGSFNPPYGFVSGNFTSDNVTVRANWYAITVDTNNNIIVAGDDFQTTHAIVARYKSDGTLDNTFNSTGTPGFTLSANDGTQAATWYAIALDTQNNIVVAGQSNVINGSTWGVVAYYHGGTGQNAGTLNTGFANGTEHGYVISTANDTDAYVWYGVVLDTNGKVVAAGRTQNSWGVVARYTPVGALDTSNPGGFTTNGYVVSSGADTNAEQWLCVTVDASNNVVVGGSTVGNPFADPVVYSYGVIARYTAGSGMALGGSLDINFNYGGAVQGVAKNTNTNEWNAITIDGNGYIVVAGETNSDWAVVARYHGGAVQGTAGTLDISFTNGQTQGYIISSAADTDAEIWNSVIIESGKVLVAGGQSELGVIARYGSSGALDTTGFNASNGYATYPTNPQGDNSLEWKGLALLQNGNILVAGYDKNNDLGTIAGYSSAGQFLGTAAAPGGTRAAWALFYEQQGLGVALLG